MTTARSGVRNTPQTEKRNGVSTSLLDVSNNEGYGIDQAGNRMTGDGENPQALEGRQADPQDAGTCTIAPATTEPLSPTASAPQAFTGHSVDNSIEQGLITDAGAAIDADMQAALELWDREDTIDAVREIMRENVCIDDDILYALLLQLTSRFIAAATSTFIIIKAPAGSGKSRLVSTLESVAGNLYVTVKDKPPKGKKGGKKGEAAEQPSSHTEPRSAIQCGSMSNQAMVYSSGLLPDGIILVMDDVGADPKESLLDAIKQSYDRTKPATRIIPNDDGSGARMITAPRMPQFIVCNTKIPAIFETDAAFQSRTIRFEWAEYTRDYVNEHIKPIMDANCSFEKYMNRKESLSPAVFKHFWDMLLKGGVDGKGGLEGIFVEIPDELLPEVTSPAKIRDYETVKTWAKCYCLFRVFRGYLTVLPTKTVNGVTMPVIKAEREDMDRAIALMNRITQNARYTPDGIQIPNPIRGIGRVVLEWFFNQDPDSRSVEDWGKVFSREMRDAYAVSSVSSANMPIPSGVDIERGRRLLEICERYGFKPTTSFAPSRFARVVCGHPKDDQKYPHGGLCGYAEVWDMGIIAETQYEPETHRAIVQITLEKHEMKETKDYTIGTSND